MTACVCEFDAWKENPYTKVLQKSIDEDYVPIGDYRKLQAELAANKRAEEAEKDAARYRWLRDKSVPPHNFYISVPVEFHGVRYTRHEVDSYIDEAMRNG